MATTYAINGTPTAIAPFSQQWMQIKIGTDHEQRALLSGNEEIVLSFDSASITMAREWLEAASTGSKTVTVLTRYGLGFTDLSGVYLEVTEYPAIEAGVSNPWAMTIKGASAN